MDFAEHALGYLVSFSAMLDNGPGWGLFFNSRVDRSNRVSGYTFQYDPGYGRGAYLLRRWVNNRESVIKAVSASLDYDVSHTFTLDITPGSLSISQDGGEVLAYTGNLPVQGDVLGFRTWGSTDATFQNVAVQSAGVAGSVPEPTTLCLLGLGGLLLVRRPVRVQSG
jgi:fructan beta-fructosidase